MGASFLPLMMFTLLWGGVGIVLPFLVPEGATQGLPESVSSDAESQQSSESSLLSFYPKFFDFNESPVGVPRLGVVRVDNRLKNENLKLISISGNTVHFHSSFFADKVIGPESNTTFEVVFLSRVEGLVESNLYIHTSKGLFKYYVKGHGLPNPYRLKPLVGARIPVNGSYEPLITMHNTHDTRIQVVEMLSSGADFHLQLPDDVEQDAGCAWAIEPFETKPVMKGSFQGKADGNHTGFIKIRVNSTTASSEYLLLPVEVQVSSEPGMYSAQDSLDFGLLVQSDKPKTLSLFIINAERKPVNIQSVSVKGPPNPAVKIEFRPLVIEPDNSVSTVVALVTFDPSQAQDPKYSHGMIQILSECGKSVTVPFRAAVMHGELEYNASSLGFFVKSDQIPPRNFSVRNNFSATVAIYHVAVSHPDLVQVNNFNQTHVIPPGEQKTIFSMKIQKKADICDARNKIEVTVKSNITNIKLPLMCYDGKLQLHTFENGEIDCGRIEMYSTHTEYFSLENKNPVEIRLKSWGSNSSWGHVELVGMQKGVKEDLERIKDYDILRKSLFLQPGHMAVFSIDIRRPTTEGSFFGEAYVTTDHNQTLRVPFRFAVSKGSVYADTFIFDKVFPGKISCEKLYLGSSYNRTLFLNGIRSRPQKLLWFTPPSENPEILPIRRSYVGKVHFDPRKFCDLECYAGFSLDSSIGRSWIRGINLGWEGGELDWDMYSTLFKRFKEVSDTTVSNISLWVDTNEVGGYKVLTQINYIWPRISTFRPVLFPLTALGNESIVEIPVSNPSTFSLVVQAILASDYGPQWSKYIAGLPGNFTGGHRAFKLDGVFSSSSQQNGSTKVQTQFFRELVEFQDDYLPGVAFVLPPGAKYFLRTSFSPNSKDIANTVILLRNNLTGIEVITAKGRAGTGQLTVGSGTPGSALLFQLTEKLLQACQGNAEPTSKYVTPQLTVRRTFIARNIGEIPLDIRVLEIYPPQNSLWYLTFGGSLNPGDSCEGYGFRILNCHPFTLQPNHTHSIDIAFTPDFTMSKVVRSLRLVDSTGGEFNYSLVAMIPSKMLSICSLVISRPSWESLLKIFLIIGVVVAMIAAGLMAYVEAGSIVSNTVVATVRVVPSDVAKAETKENTSKLDLKAVYDKVENRFKRNQKEAAIKSSSPPAIASPPTPITAPKAPVVSNSVLSNSNSTLRNRRTKKIVLEPSIVAPKLSDKSNQKSSSPPAEDISLVSNSTGSTCNKKDKENSPSSSASSSAKKKKPVVVTQLNVQVSSPPVPLPTSKQKKSGSVSSKEQEDTSSTTTESSNSDDFYIPPPSAEKKSNGKFPNDQSQVKGAKKEKSEKKKPDLSKDNNILDLSGAEGLFQKAEDKRKNSKRKEQLPLFSETVKSDGKASPRLEVSLWDSPQSPRGDGLSELAAQTEAFIMHRPNKKCGSSELLMGSGLTATNERNPRSSNSPQFSQVIQMANNFQPQQFHPNNNSGNARHRRPAGIIGQSRYGQTGNTGLISPTGAMYQNGHQPPHQPPHQSARQHTPPSRTLSNPNAMMNHVSNWGSEILPDNGCDIWSRKNSLESTGLSQTFSSVAGSNATNDMPMYSTGNMMSQYPFFDGFPTSTSPGLSNRSSDDGGYYSLGSGTTASKIPGGTSAGSSYGTTGNSSRTASNDRSQVFNLGMELFNNLLPMNSAGYDPSAAAYRPSVYTPAGRTQVSQTSEGMHNHNTSHGYLQRMRSEPTNRDDGFASSTRKQKWNELNYFDPMAGGSSQPPRHISQTSTSPGGLEPSKAEGSGVSWPSVGNSVSSSSGVNNDLSRDRSLFSEWGALGSAVQNAGGTVQNVAEIWEPALGNLNADVKWPTSYVNTPSQNTYSDSAGAGARGRMDMVGDLGYRGRNADVSQNDLGFRARNADISQNDLSFRSRNADVPQSHREVEAGLGFNPFTSDIWNQNHSDTNWTSTGSSYGYSNRD